MKKDVLATDKKCCRKKNEAHKKFGCGQMFRGRRRGFVGVWCMAAIWMVVCTACGESDVHISQPEQAVTVHDSSFQQEEKAAVENSVNVNGKRFTLTLFDFTSRLNAEKNQRGEKDMYLMEKWKKNGQVTKDNKGVKIQYYYYDDSNTNLTATVEADSEKLVNVGCGTTLSYFTGKDKDKNNSDNVIYQAALAAQIVCGYDCSYLNTIQNIFYATTKGVDTSLYYDGFVFSFTTKTNHANKDNDLMMFRVFPVEESLKEEWKLKEYQP